jgi:hypothetical protein
MQLIASAPQSVDIYQSIVHLSMTPGIRFLTHMGCLVTRTAWR